MESTRVKNVPRRVALVVWLLALALAALNPVLAQSADPEVVVVEVDGPIIPPIRSYIQRGIEQADETDAAALVVVLNTPGGSGSVMQGIVSDIRASRVPVIVYVAPSGAMAGSAGTLITLAGHAAAMAPETAIGAASPVGPGGEELPETLAAKSREIVSAQARGLAEPRGEEAVELADKAITEAKAVNVTEALAANFVDFRAEDIADLLEQADGFDVTVRGDTVTLRTAGAIQEPLPLSDIERLLTILADPNLVFTLITIGTAALIFEITNPGGWAAGAVGITCLALGLYGIGVLPINWVGGVFILMSFILFLLDVKAPSHGALTAAAVISLIAGGILLFDTPQLQAFDALSIPLVVFVSLLVAATFFFIIGKAIQTQVQKPIIGAEGMVGMIGRVVEPLDPEGTVLVASERWRASLANGDAIPANARVEVVEVQGFALKVRLAELPPETDRTPEGEPATN